MAFNAIKINPLDLNPSLGIGIALPFNCQEIFQITYTTAETVKANLVNFMLTNFGERPLNPTFGANLQGILFELMSEDNISAIDLTLTQTIQQNFTSIIVNNVEVNPDHDNNTLNLVLNYSIKDTNINDNIEITLV